MKKIFGILLVLGLPMAALAQPIALSAGSSVIINEDVVSCQAAPDEQVPVCSIKQDGGMYRLLAGSTLMQSFYSFDQAIEGAKKSHDAGLCR